MCVEVRQLVFVFVFMLPNCIFSFEILLSIEPADEVRAAWSQFVLLCCMIYRPAFIDAAVAA